MITDKHKSQTLISWCQTKISLSDLKLENTPSVLQHWAVWLIIIKFIKQKWTLKSASKKTIQSGHDLTKKHSETSLMAKVPSKNQQFWKSSESPSKLSLEETRHASPNLDRERSAKYRYSSNMAEHDSSHISSLTILDQPTKGQYPHPQPPLFSKHFLISIFFQIWRFLFWRLFPVGDSIACFERFD